MAIVAAVRVAIWDLEKETENVRRHGVDFHEATRAAVDPLARRWPDRDHSMHEERTKVIGYSTSGRLLTVVTTDADDGTLRIISAWRATKRERHDYEER